MTEVDAPWETEKVLIPRVIAVVGRDTTLNTLETKSLSYRKEVNKPL